MEKKEGYLIRYLPQHGPQARKVITLITELLPGLKIPQDLPPNPNTDKPKAKTSANGATTKLTSRTTPAPAHQPMPKEEPKLMDKWIEQQSNSQPQDPDLQEHGDGFWYRIHAPGRLSYLPDAQQYQKDHPRCLSKVVIPSNYHQDQWLLALWQLLQDTAWDRWRYQNGVRRPAGPKWDESLQQMTWYTIH